MYLFSFVKLAHIHPLISRERPKSNYRIQLNAEIDLDIPDTCIQTSEYNATLGHKANHSFTPNGTFDLFEHPRFGLIRAILSQEEIRLKTGEFSHQTVFVLEPVKR